MSRVLIKRLLICFVGGDDDDIVVENGEDDAP